MASLRILIVDDNPIVRRGIRSIVDSRRDWSVCGEAADGREGVEKAQQLRPDVVLMDISMPVLDGLQATRIIRRELPESKVIIVTQNDPEVARRQAAEVDAKGFIAKSEMSRELVQKIEQVISIPDARGKRQSDSADVETSASDLFVMNTAMSDLMRSKDWSETPLGRAATWSPALRMMVKFLLANRFPQLLWWGPQFCCLYNDAYIPILGAKHPWALGRPTAEVWQEIWSVLRPLVETPFQGGPATWMEDIGLELNRSGFVEETHFTIAYSPVPDDSVAGGIGGVIATVHEISEKVVGERRVGVLRDLGARSAEPKTADEACTVAAHTLARHAKDIPFALIYLIDEKQTQAYFAAGSGIDGNDRAFPRTLSLELGKDRTLQDWPVSTGLIARRCAKWCM